MGVGEFGGNAAALGADDEAFLNKERFIYFFKRAGIFRYGSCKGSHTNRTTLERNNKSLKYLIVN